MGRADRYTRDVRKLFALSVVATLLLAYGCGASEERRREPDDAAGAGESAQAHGGNTEGPGGASGLDGGMGGAGFPTSAAGAGSSASASGAQTLTPSREVMLGSLSNPATSDPRSNTPKPTIEERIAMPLDPELCVKLERLPNGEIRRRMGKMVNAQSAIQNTHGTGPHGIKVCQ